MASFGLGPNWEGAEMEAVSRPSTTTTRRLPPFSGEPGWPEPHREEGVWVAKAEKQAKVQSGAGESLQGE